MRTLVSRRTSRLFLPQLGWRTSALDLLLSSAVTRIAFFAFSFFIGRVTDANSVAT